MPAEVSVAHSAGAPRIHITGAAGSGVSTLGAALARALDLVQIDVDDVFWMPTDPPFTTKRPTEDRVRLVRERAGAGGWVLAGSMDGWGDQLLGEADLVVMVEVPSEIRLERIRRREQARFGSRLAPGGDMHEGHEAFMAWAAGYDDPAFSGRNRARHLRLFKDLTAPVLMLDGTESTEALCAEVVKAVDDLRAAPRATP